MGGPGSGRRARKRTTEQIEQPCQISIGFLKPMLTTGQKSFPVGRSSLNGGFDLTWTDCHYGSQRPWFVCPHCKKRKGVLYQSIAATWLCRSCNGLTYQSQRDDYANRFWRICQQYKEQYGIAPGWHPSGRNGPANAIRPKGQHRKTFERNQEKFWAEWEQFEQQWLKRARRQLALY